MSKKSRQEFLFYGVLCRPHLLSKHLVNSVHKAEGVVVLLILCSREPLGHSHPWSYGQVSEGHLLGVASFGNCGLRPRCGHSKTVSVGAATAVVLIYVLGLAMRSTPVELPNLVRGDRLVDALAVFCGVVRM